MMRYWLPMYWALGVWLRTHNMWNSAWGKDLAIDNLYICVFTFTGSVQKSTSGTMSLSLSVNNMVDAKSVRNLSAIFR